MIQSLKRRFIFFSMGAVTGLLLFLVLAINGLNGIMLEHQSDMVMRILVDSDGAFRKMDLDRPPPMGRPLDMDRMRSSRFFIVQCHEDGQILSINMEQISSVNEAAAAEYAHHVLESGKSSGHLKKYRFAVKTMGTSRLIFFMDISEQRDNFLRVALVSLAIAVFCWIILLILVVGLSGRVIRPVIAGMEKQKQFITNAGHEMKTPLAIIQTNNDTMALIHGENKYNANIRSQTRRLNGLMSDLLTLARLDEEIPLVREPVEISKEMEELLLIFREEALAKGFDFQAEVEPDVLMKTSRDGFRQLMSILLDNAMKYTSDGGRIHLQMRKKGRYLLILQENTCDLRREADPERLFERFYRGDGARTQQKETAGYGIGLSAARAICENLGGTLTAEYPSDSYIRFTAKLPVNS